jgi:hypothetical protein
VKILLLLFVVTLIGCGPGPRPNQVPVRDHFGDTYYFVSQGESGANACTTKLETMTGPKYRGCTKFTWLEVDVKFRPEDVERARNAHTLWGEE